MLRIRRSFTTLLIAQFVLLGVVGVIWGLSTTSAQKGTETDPSRLMLAPDLELAKSSMIPSVTIGTLPPRRPGYGYLSLPTSAFQPAESGYVYSNFGKNIYNYNSPALRQTWVADVQLPQGAIATGLVMIGGDVAPDPQGSLEGTLQLALLRSKLDELNLDPGNPNPSERTIVQVQSYPNTPMVTDLGIYTSTVDLSSAANVAVATSDPSLYAYQLLLAVPANPSAPTPNTIFRSARIEYAFPNTVNLPFISK